jgi:hypothetical protein
MSLSIDSVKPSTNRPDLLTPQETLPAQIQRPPLDSLEQPSENGSSSSMCCFTCICALLASFFRYLFCMSRPREEQASLEKSEPIIEKEKTEPTLTPNPPASSSAEETEQETSFSLPIIEKGKTEPTLTPNPPASSSAEKTKEETSSSPLTSADTTMKKRAAEIEARDNKKLEDFLLKVKNDWAPCAHEKALKEATDDFKRQEVTVQNKILYHCAKHQMFNVVALYLDLLRPSRKNAFEAHYGRPFKPTEISRECLLKIFKTGF